MKQELYCHLNLIKKVKVKSLSPVRLLATPWQSYKAPPSMEFSSGLPFPSPGDLPDPGIEPGLVHWSPVSHTGTGSRALQADPLPSEPPGKPKPYKGRKKINYRSISLINMEVKI